MSGGRPLAAWWAASSSGAVIILAILLLRALFQSRTPRRAFCLLWDLALVRLLIPGALPSPVSIWRWLPAPAAAQRVGLRFAAAPGLTSPANEAFINGTVAWPGNAALPALSLDAGAIITAVWLAGALALAAWFIREHLRSRRLYTDSLPCGDAFARDWLKAHHLRRRVRVRTSDRIPAPLTYGVLRPIILLPAGLEWPDKTALSFIFEHEIQHIRHFDTLRKGLLAAAACLHWFNPLIWTMYVLCGRDMELACDEAVTAGGADRAGYARTLLQMEEQRGRWGLLGLHFSQNALEERIKAIMKHKQISPAAWAAIFIATGVAVTVFASAAPAGKSEQTPPETGYVDGHSQTVEDVMILSKGGEDGEKQYSADGGKTWMSEEDYRARYGGSDWQVEWWTAEDYAAWLEEEKQLLQSIIGERGYTGGEGWFTWDQKRVDETIALYEEILRNIQNGALYSKTITDKNGSAVEDVALGSGTLNMAAIFSIDEKDTAAPGAVDEDALRKDLRSFGIGGEAERLTYNGQLIRCLVDGVPVGGSGYSIQYVYTNPNGTMDVHTLRSVIHHPDGSYDPMGGLIGVAAKGEAGFDQGLIDAASGRSAPAAYAEGTGRGGTTFEEIFARYEAYGLVYSPRESGMGSLFWNGRAVKSFADLKPDGGTFSYEDPHIESGLRVYTQYDAAGRLTGIYAE